MKKERDINIELLRIMAMFLVLAYHSNISIGQISVAELNKDFSGATIRLLTNVLCSICVNIFVIISGWYGLNYSNKKLGGLFFQVFFWCGLSAFIYILTGNDFTYKKIVSIFGLDGQLWFVLSYTILLAISPILNYYASTATKEEFRKTLIIFFALQTLFGWGMKIGYFADGYSPLSFIGLYLLAKYIHKFPNKYTTLHPINDITIYLITSIITTATIILIATTLGEFVERLSMYISPLIIISALYFVLFFTKINITKGGKTIFYLSESAFAVYLFHDNIFLAGYFRQTVRYIYENYGSISLIAALILLFLLIATIDKTRIFLWETITNKTNHQPLPYNKT
ncbi:MAG: acyltransferase family protein [Bacteroidaceae bacterium]|nr:acyltransferase family protein [Bacteroidaceae bacterium]